MIVFFEGADGSGKTTLLNIISNRLTLQNYTVDNYGNKAIPTHPAAKDRVNEKQLFKALKKMAVSKVVYLVDRGPISDFIYRVFDDNKCVTTMTKFINFLKEYNKQIFIVYCDSNESYNKMLERGEDNPTALNKHQELRKVYNMFMFFLFNEIKFNRSKVNPFVNSHKEALITDINYFAFMNAR